MAGSLAASLRAWQLVALLGSVACVGPTDAETSNASESEISTEEAEARTVARFERLGDSPDELKAFISAMPKGADLHTHLSGAVNAESYIEWARNDRLCIDRKKFSLAPMMACILPKYVRLPRSQDPFYEEIVRAWSMKDFVPSVEESGRDHFFATFEKFGLVTIKHTGDMIAEVMTHAAADNEQYVELMFGISARKAMEVGDRLSRDVAIADFAAFHASLLARDDWKDVLDEGSRVLDQGEARARAALQCSEPAPKPGCGIAVRYLYQVSRTKTPPEVFAQMAAAFEIAIRDRRIVGMNLASPEDDPVALRDYDLHMSMLDFLYEKYRGRSPLRIALHAGELTAAVLPAEREADLTFHIRRAMEVGHAERIGHALTLATEHRSSELLAELRQRNVLVELCLTSNSDIVDVAGKQHPAATYLREGVPLAITTDDAGVGRTNMTKEYLRAATEHGFGYLDLKTAARNSLEHSFLPGESLWRTVQPARRVEACGSVQIGQQPNGECKALLARSERARLEWALEERFAAFEHGS